MFLSIFNGRFLNKGRIDMNWFSQEMTLQTTVSAIKVTPQYHNNNTRYLTPFDCYCYTRGQTLLQKQAYVENDINNIAASKKTKKKRIET